MYNVSIGAVKREYKTIDGKRDPDTESVAISIIGDLGTGIVKVKYKQGDKGYDDLFINPPVPKRAVPVINSVTDPQGTFSKAAEADVAINVTSSANDNSIEYVMINSKKLTNEITVTGLKVKLSKNHLKTLENGQYTVVIKMLRGNDITYVLRITA